MTEQAPGHGPKRGVALVLVGTELLTAKIQDENGPYLLRRLRERAIPVRSVQTVPDEVDPIVEAVIRARARAEHVFTSGGIGPTHDDVTVRAVAMALGRRVVRHPRMVELLRSRRGDSLTEEELRIADAPEGAELLEQPGLWLPTLTCDNVYMLPGVPALFRLQAETVLARLRPGRLCARALYLNASEAEIASGLDRVALSAPDVGIGSYPTFDAALDYRVKLTVEAEDPARVQEVIARLLTELPRGCVVREE